MLVIIISALLYVSVYDCVYKKIPNYIVVIIGGLGFIYNGLLIGSTDITISLYGLVAGLFVALFFYRFAALGAGDVKLIAAIGCVVGYPLILVTVAYSYIASVAFGVIYIWVLWRSKNQKTGFTGAKSVKMSSQRIPMAPGISMATFYVLFNLLF